MMRKPTDVSGNIMPFEECFSCKHKPTYKEPKDIRSDQSFRWYCGACGRNDGDRYEEQPTRPDKSV